MRNLFAAFVFALSALAAPIATAAPRDNPRVAVLADAGAPVRVETAPSNAPAFVYLGEVDTTGAWLHANWVSFAAPVDVALPREGVEVRTVAIAAHAAQGVKLRSAPNPRASQVAVLKSGAPVEISRLHVNWGHVWGETRTAHPAVASSVRAESPCNHASQCTSPALTAPAPFVATLPRRQVLDPPVLEETELLDDDVVADRALNPAAHARANDNVDELLL